MSNFSCECCGKVIIDSPSGYITGCEHHPIEPRRLTLAEQVKMARAEVATWPPSVQEATRLPLDLMPK